MQILTKRDLVLGKNKNVKYIAIHIPGAIALLWSACVWTNSLVPDWQYEIAIVGMLISIIGLFWCSSQLKKSADDIDVYIDEVVGKLKTRGASNGKFLLLQFKEHDSAYTTSYTEYEKCQPGDKYFIIKRGSDSKIWIYNCKEYELGKVLKHRLNCTR